MKDPFALAGPYAEGITVQNVEIGEAGYHILSHPDGTMAMVRADAEPDAIIVGLKYLQRLRERQ